MKKIWKTILLLTLLSMQVWAVEKKEIYAAVFKAVPEEGDTYLRIREQVVGKGTNALPFLVQAATDKETGWRERLVARIWYEHILRNRDIEDLRKHDWRQYPPYQTHNDPSPEYHWVTKTNSMGKIAGKVLEPKNPIPFREGGSILGRQTDMPKYAVPKFKETGLWYYYLETYWKKTGETTLPEIDVKFSKAWPWWGVTALEDQPEQYYRIRILMDWLEKDKTFANPWSKEYYMYLRRKKIPDAVPVLMKRLLAYRQRVRAGINTPDEDDEMARMALLKVFSFAHSGHADLIEKYIAEHPALAPLKEKLPEVRARQAPPPMEEPPFRLGTNLVIVK